MKKAKLDDILREVKLKEEELRRLQQQVVDEREELQHFNQTADSKELERIEADAIAKEKEEAAAEAKAKQKLAEETLAAFDDASSDESDASDHSEGSSAEE